MATVTGSKVGREVARSIARRCEYRSEIPRFNKMARRLLFTPYPDDVWEVVVDMLVSAGGAVGTSRHPLTACCNDLVSEEIEARGTKASPAILVATELLIVAEYDGETYSPRQVAVYLRRWRHILDAVADAVANGRLNDDVVVEEEIFRVWCYGPFSPEAGRLLEIEGRDGAGELASEPRRKRKEASHEGK